MSEGYPELDPLTVWVLWETWSQRCESRRDGPAPCQLQYLGERPCTSPGNSEELALIAGVVGEPTLGV